MMVSGIDFARSTPAAASAMSHPQPPVVEQSTAANSAVTSLLQHDGMRSVIARYMTVQELVVVRGVSSLWRRLFDQPCCWHGSRLEPTDSQLYDHHLRLATLPHLQQLTLAHGIQDFDDESRHEVYLAFEHLLTACTDLAVQKVTVQGAINAAMVQAMPHLQQLTVTGTVHVDSIPLLSRQLVSVEASAIDDEVLVALAKHPLPQLQRIGTLSASLPRFQQFILAHPALSSLTLMSRRTDDKIIPMLETLGSLNTLTDLHLQYVHADGGLMNALCDLPQLQRLTVTATGLSPDVPGPNPTSDFWSRVPTLHTLLHSHQTGKQKPSDFRIRCCAGSTKYSDDWWVGALRASFYCSQLGLTLLKAPESAWQRFLSDTRYMPPSMLQMVRLMDSQAETMTRFVPYVKLHTGLTSVDLDHDINDSELYAMLACLPHLRQLTVHHADPSIVQLALTASGSLTQIQYLHNDCTTAAALSDMLKLVGAAISLKSADVTAPSRAWSTTTLKELQQFHNDTHNMTKLNLSIDSSDDLSSRDVQELTNVVSQLLLLPPLTYLAVPKRSQLLTIDQMTEIRRQARLNSVYMDVY